MLTLSGGFALGRVWFQASLPAPEALVVQGAQFQEAASHAAQAMDMGDPEAISALFDALFNSMMQESDGSLTALHGVFGACLPALPPDSREALARVAVRQKAPIFADLGCAWLLEQFTLLRRAAVMGLNDRQNEDRLSRATLSRLAVIRSWIPDGETRAGVDGIIREAMRRNDGKVARAAVKPKIHRIVASVIDGSGAQSIAVAVQGGAGRMVAIVLIKEGHGVKDAYVVPCRSAGEQKRLLAEIVDNIDGADVSPDYLATVLSLAMAEGAARGHAPAPGLIEVAAACGLTDLRPTSGELADIIRVIDPQGRVAARSAQARGRLINASRDWDDDYPFLGSWFEDSDEIFDALDAARSPAAAKKALWAFLERRRDHWARVIARTGVLVADVGGNADEFVATALALAEGRDLKKTPIMGLIFEQTAEVWSARRGGVGLDTALMGPQPAPAQSLPAPEKAGELAQLLRSAPIVPVRLDGYLLACCIAPRPVMPGEWIEPVFGFVAPTLDERHAQRFLDIVMLRYNATLQALHDGQSMVPADPDDWPAWADGLLTAWEETKPHWPADALSKQGKAMRRMLVGLTNGIATRTVTDGALEKWIREYGPGRNRRMAGIGITHPVRFSPDAKSARAAEPASLARFRPASGGWCSVGLAFAVRDPCR